MEKYYKVKHLGYKDDLRSLLQKHLGECLRYMTDGPRESLVIKIETKELRALYQSKYGTKGISPKKMLQQILYKDISVFLDGALEVMPPCARR